MKITFRNFPGYLLPVQICPLVYKPQSKICVTPTSLKPHKPKTFHFWLVHLPGRQQYSSTGALKSRKRKGVQYPIKRGGKRSNKCGWVTYHQVSTGGVKVLTIQHLPSKTLYQHSIIISLLKNKYMSISVIIYSWFFILRYFLKLLSNSLPTLQWSTKGLPQNPYLL